MKRIGFVAALAQEAKTLAPLARAANGAMVCLVEIAGVGLANAEKAAGRLIGNKVDALISWGTAGALNTDYPPGTLLIYSSVARHDGAVLECDPALTAALQQSLTPLACRTTLGLTTEVPIATTVDKARLGNTVQAGAVDMETYAVAAFAAKAGIPFSAVRAIVDPAGFELPYAALAALTTTATPQWLRMLAALARRPWEILALIRLGHWYALALRRLTQAATLLGNEWTG